MTQKNNQRTRYLNQKYQVSRRFLLTGATLLPAIFWLDKKAHAVSSDWDAILSRAKGQEVRFNAWGGDSRINDYILWAGNELQARFDIKLSHVKLADTADAVSRILAEKAAGLTKGGSVDLIWINGENFAALKSANLLFGPFTEDLPNMRWVDADNRPTMRTDFSLPTDGLEAPWGRAQLVFFYDSARVSTPPRSMASLRDWLQKNPGRFTYPAPPDFLGTSFLKQALYETASNPLRLATPTDVSASLEIESLWSYLEALHPYLWRQGKIFPKTSAEARNLVADQQTDLYFAFNPSDASSAIQQGLLPPTIRPILWSAGTIGNTHFLAIPFNSSATEAAMVAIDFLLSPEAQAAKENAEIWGDPTVLSMAKLDDTTRSLFNDLPRRIATPAPGDLGEPLPEPHVSWVELIEQEWKKRFAA